jgi:hypothetical protein
MRLFFAAVTLVALAASPALAKAPVVEDSQFLVYLIGPGGSTDIIESDIVPLIPDHVCFGWRIRISGTGKVVKQVEELTLPIAPQAWVGIEDDEYSPTQLSADRRTATTTTFVTPQDGWLENTWCIAPGDPAGPHTIRVLAEGSLLREFDFTVSEPDALR